MVEFNPTDISKLNDAIFLEHDVIRQTPMGCEHTRMMLKCVPLLKADIMTYQSIVASRSCLVCNSCIRKDTRNTR